MRGAIREDDYTATGAPNPRDDDPYNVNIPPPLPPNPADQRPLNHFYDPVRHRPLTVVAPLGDRAPDWSLGVFDAVQAPDAPNPTRRNHFTLLDAREALYRALTGRGRVLGAEGDGVAPSDSERKKYWATTFRALGDVVHLVEDMAQPPHTRNGLQPRSLA